MPYGYKSPGVILAEIRMLRMAGDMAVLVVEGVDDERFWSHVGRRHKECEVVVAEGKPNLLGAVEMADERRMQGILGLVDEDYDELLSVDRSSRNVVSTGVHDLECVLCRSSALEAVLAEFGKERSIREFTEKEAKGVREALLARSAVFGRLRYVWRRWYSGEARLELPVARFVNEDTWEVDEGGIMGVVALRGVEDDVRRRVDELGRVDLWKIVNGHDVVQVLRIGLRGVLGDGRKQSGAAQIGAVLRSALPRVELLETEMWRSIVGWETRNPRYRVLAEG